MVKIKPREFCLNVFSEMDLLTLLCLHILEVLLYSLCCKMTRGGDIHRYGTRTGTASEFYNAQLERLIIFPQMLVSV